MDEPLRVLACSNIACLIFSPVFLLFWLSSEFMPTTGSAEVLHGIGIANIASG